MILEFPVVIGTIPYSGLPINAVASTSLPSTPTTERLALPPTSSQAQRRSPVLNRPSPTSTVPLPAPSAPNFDDLRK